MEHSLRFEKVKKHFNRGFWDETRVKNAVIKNWITEAEYEEITNLPYSKSQEELS